MSLVLGRDGSISLFRVGTLIAILGVLLVVGGIAAYFLDQNSYRTPLEVAPFPNAEVWGLPSEGRSARRVLYIAGATPEDVAAYYEQQLQSNGGVDQGCERIPSAGSVAASQSDPTVVPYWFICLFQRNGLGVSQQTTITIQPGVQNPDPNMDTQGMTVIEHSQRWQP